MRTKLLFFGLSFMLTNAMCQVGIGTTTPSPVSMLEVSSQTNGTGPYRGLMPPRVPNVTARNSINPTPSDAGLLIFLDSSGCIQLWTGLNWENVKCSDVHSNPALLLGKHNFEVIPAIPNLLLSEIVSGMYFIGLGSFPKEPMYVSPERGYGIIGGDCTIEFGPIDASEYTFVTIKFHLASFSIANPQGADLNDTVMLSVSINGGPYINELQITGYLNAKWGFSNTNIVSSNYKGDGSLITFQSRDLLSTGIGNVELKNIPAGPNISFQISMKNDRPDEIWVIDDIEVFGL